MTRPAGLPINSIRNRKQPTSIFRHSRIANPASAGNPGEVSFRAVFVLMIQRAAFAGQLQRLFIKNVRRLSRSMKSLLFLSLCLLFDACAYIPAPTASEDYAKLIVGRWGHRNRIITFHPDGTWGVQRHETAPEYIDGRRWRIEGKTLFLTWRGDRGVQTNASKIISFTPREFTIESNGYKDIYDREP
ncbi:MAG TPA: hypothetical protein VK327_03030 [Candidatus Paceibacterota bacterium]|nr:hypothetical protein [Candidatus Paceibacterota bacterium]